MQILQQSVVQFSGDTQPLSSKNSTRHGILAQTIVLDSESKTRFEELLGGYTNEFQPRTPAESTLVEAMAVARWRQLRVCHVQRATIDVEMARNQASASSNPVRAAAVFRDLSDNSRTLDLLLRYETAFERQFTRALYALMKLQTRPKREDALDLPHQTDTAATWDPEELAPEEPNLPNEPTNPLKRLDQPGEPGGGSSSQTLPGPRGSESAVGRTPSSAPDPMVRHAESASSQERSIDEPGGRGSERAIAFATTSRAATARERSTDEPRAKAAERCVPELSGTSDVSDGTKVAVDTAPPPL